MSNNNNNRVSPERVAVYDNGVKYDFVKPFCKKIKLCKKKQKNKRNKILCFSKSSRRRMRDFMLCYEVLGMVRCGITLTLPWSLDYNNLPAAFLSSFYLKEFAEVVHRFRVAWLRRFPLCGCVYRVELQQRKMPHLHLISFHHVDDLPLLKDEYFRLWFNSLGSLFGGSFKGFYLYGVNVDTALSSARALSYLSDHSSKSKQAQLGYKGKQWGVWGKDNFSRVLPSVYHFASEYEFNFFARHVRRFRRFYVDAPCVFGRKKSRACNVMQSCQFLSRRTLARLYRLSRWAGFYKLAVDIHPHIMIYFSCRQNKPIKG